MKHTSIITQLKALKKEVGSINPDLSWVKEKRRLLLSQIENTVTTKQVVQKNRATSWTAGFAGIVDTLHIGAGVFFSPRVLYRVRSIAVVVSALALTLGGWTVGVSASHNSLPTDTIRYQFKLASEKIQLSLASGDKHRQTELNLSFATKRAQEVKELTKQDTPKAEEKTTQTIERLEKTIAVVNSGLNDVSQGEPEKTIALATNISKQTTDIVSTLKEISQDAQTKDKDVTFTKGVIETAEHINDVGLNAIETGLKAIDTVPSEKKEGHLKEVGVAVEEKVASLLEQVRDIESSAKGVAEDDALLSLSRQNVTGATTTDGTLNGANTNMESADGVPVSTTSIYNGMMTSTTVSSTLSATVPKETITQEVKKVTQTGEETKGLLEGDRFLEALQKAKTLNGITSETQQVLLDVKKRQEEGKNLLLLGQSQTAASSESPGGGGPTEGKTIDAMSSTIQKSTNVGAQR